MARRLRRSDPTKPGFGRVDGDRIVDANGRTVRDEATLERVRALIIPPAWHDVWISPHENGHIQVIGTDDAGRRQYLYHDEWRRRRDAEKFDRALDLAAALPRARRLVSRDLGAEGLEITRALGAAFRFIDLSSLRIGSEQYLRAGRSRGLTTLQCRHVIVEEMAIRLTFPGKSGQLWDSMVEDRALAAFATEVIAARGPRSRFLGWHDRRWHTVSPAEVNEYLRLRTGAHVSAKDFRTLRGTIIAAEALAGSVDAAGGTAKARSAAVREAVRATSAVLGNTPAVARSSYIDPRVFELFEQGTVIELRPRRSVEARLRALLEPESIRDDDV